MKRFSLSASIFALGLNMLGFVSGESHAQSGRELTLQRPFETSGFAAEDLMELRIYLTPKANVVRGEVVLGGRTNLQELSITLEGGPVRFVRSGEAGNGAGDVYAAQFSMDTSAVFKAKRAELVLAQRMLRNNDGDEHVRFGPRMVVSRDQAVRRLRTDFPEQFEQMLRSTRLNATFSRSDSPLEAARAAGIDIRKTPLLVLPGPRFNDPRRIAIERFFDIAMVVPFRPQALGIDGARSLMVVDTSVVEDSARTFDACTNTGTKGGRWSFGYLMRELAKGTGVTPEEFAERWLATWAQPQMANGWLVPGGERGDIHGDLMNSWRNLSPGGALDVDHFPARLLAIVNRPDLADKGMAPAVALAKDASCSA